MDRFDVSFTQSRKCSQFVIETSNVEGVARMALNPLPGFDALRILRARLGRSVLIKGRGFEKRPA